MEAPGESHIHVSQRVARTHGKWHGTSSWGEGVERGQTRVTSFTASFILEKEINDTDINKVARI